MNNISEMDKRVLGALDTRPRKSRDLQLVTGYTDTEIREAIRRLRFMKVKICSGSMGFWLWDGEDDSWRHTKNQIKSRIDQLTALYRAMEYPDEENQLKMDL